MLMNEETPDMEVAMMRPLRVAVIGEFNKDFPPHVATCEGLQHSANFLSLHLDAVWLSSNEFVAGADRHLQEFDAVYVAPGSPFASLEGCLNAITFARENSVPTIGTCGGYQYLVIEYARRVLGYTEAQHAEHDPEASELFIARLACSLVGRRLEVHLVPGTRAADFYPGSVSEEQYYCNFGLNPHYRDALEAGGFRASGTDADGEARILELSNHPFYVATLFVPPLSSSAESPHPLLVAFLKAAQKRAESARASVAGPCIQNSASNE
jgi:CTP synthase (UTP-ammonia lyase)